MHVEQRHAKLGIFGLRGAGERNLRHRHAQLLRDKPDGFRERNVLDLLYELENVTRCSAAETVIELSRGMH